MTGRAVRINFATGTVTEVDAPDYGKLEARIAELEYDLRCARYDAEAQRDRAEQALRVSGLACESERQFRSACWRLVDRKRKTLRMADLLDALESP